MVDTALMALCARKNAAWERLTAWGATNTYGKSAGELVEIDLGFRRAQNEFMAASAAYEAALSKAVEEKGDD